MNGKKTVVIVSGSQRVLDSLARDVRFVLGDHAEVRTLLHTQVEQMSRVDGDVFLVTRRKNIGGLPDKVGEGRPILRVTRTIYKSSLNRIMSIPPGSRVLVVNDSYTSAMSMRTLLIDLYPDLRYIIYTPGMYDPSLTIAITPGEARFVPEFVEEVIDVGDRHIDMITFMNLLNALEMNTVQLYQNMMRYVDMIAERGLMSRQYQEDLSHSVHLESILQSMEQGVILTMASGEIVLSNRQTEQILGCRIPEKSVSLQDVFSSEICEKLLAMSNNTQMLKISEREIFVKHSSVRFSSSVYEHLFFFSDITHLHNLEQSVSAHTREQGFVAAHTFSDIVCVSQTMRTQLEQMALFARSDMTVLLQGETGTGKELAAQAIHNASLRCQQPFVAVNCAALPESLLESELFGYERGAFTGARQNGKMGVFEMANGGTLFLDEIGDMPPLLQSRLLRVLQERQLMRIGGSRMISLNVRIIAATNQDLLRKMEEGTFRRDLYYRLNVLSCKLAPLRERRDDILPLFLHFTHESSLPASVGARLTAYDWPGNVRELQNAANYYSMMRGFADPLPSYLPRISQAPVPEEAVLRAVGDGCTGRAALLERLRGEGCEISEYALRRLLDDLESRGLLVRSLGCRGTTLSDAGRKLLG